MIQSPTGHPDAFDCARGKLIAGIVAPLEPSLCRRTRCQRQHPHLVSWTVEPVRIGTSRMGGGSALFVEWGHILACREMMSIMFSCEENVRDLTPA
jgi:hypothetical protein